MYDQFLEFYKTSKLFSVLEIGEQKRITDIVKSSRIREELKKSTEVRNNITRFLFAVTTNNDVNK